MRPRKKEKQEKGAPKWLVTFSDMITLILVFFILLFSMSQIDIVKFKAVVESFNKNVIFDHYPSVVPFDTPSELSIEITETEPIEDVQKTKTSNNDYDSNQQEDQMSQSSTQQDELGHLLEEVNQYLVANGLEDVVTANRSERGVVLVLQEKVLFKSGQAEILNDAKPFLNKVGMLLKNIPNPVKVEGHTDNRPISTFRYPSNWELSAARAGSVIRFLESQHDLMNRRFTAIGYGDTRPVVPNDSPQNWETNRRVEIVISDPEYKEDSN